MMTTFGVCGRCSDARRGGSVMVVDSGCTTMASVASALESIGVSVAVCKDNSLELTDALRAGVGTVFVSSGSPCFVLRVARTASEQMPAPSVVCVGQPAAPDEMFEFGRAGVAAFLKCPVEAAALQECLAHSEIDAMRALARALLGRVGLRDAQRELRYCMVADALRLCRGSRKSAARLLRVSRTAIQRVLRECEAPGTRGGRGHQFCCVQGRAPQG